MPLFRNRGKMRNQLLLQRDESCAYKLPVGCSWGTCFSLACKTLPLVIFTNHSNPSAKPPHMKDCVAEIAKCSSTWASIQVWLWRVEPSLYSLLQEIPLPEMRETKSMCF